MSLTLVHSRALHSFTVLPSDACWLYADDDPQTVEKIDRQFGFERRLISPADFQVRAANLRAPFMAWMDCCLQNEVAEDWIPASYFKDIYSTPVFLHLVCLHILNEALQTKQSLVVVSGSEALALQLRQLAGEMGQPFTLIGENEFRRDARRVRLLAWRHLLLRPLRLLAASLLSKVVLGRKQIQRLKEVEILVDSFLLDGDLDSSGRYHDRFLPGLLDYYHRYGLIAASAASTEAISFLRLKDVYSAMARSQTLFSPTELFLQLRDIIQGQWNAWRALKRVPDFALTPFQGVAIQFVAGFWWSIAIRHSVVARILIVVGDRMASRGIRPRLYLDWFENQPLDKGMQIAFSYPGSSTETVAVRQYFPAENVVSFFSSSGEVARGVVPRVNWACGRRTAELFARHDLSGIYRAVPALRYSHLYTEQEPLPAGDQLVLFLTSGLDESLTILNLVFARIEQSLAHFDSIRVKTHQALKTDIVTLANKRWPQIRNLAVTWENGASSELLQSAALVLTAGSSVAIEALCRGVPVVLTGRTAGLDVNPLEDIDSDAWRSAYSPEDFASLLKNWLPGLPPIAERRAAGLKLRAEYFEPVTEDGMRVFLPA